MGRAPCCDKNNVKRGPWSPEEDALLKGYVEAHGTGGNWIALPKKAGLRRCGKSCRLRWLNYLRPDIKHGGFTAEEDKIIYSLYNEIGSRWSVIASQLPGRTDNDVKNYWNTKLKKKLLVSNEKMNVTSNSTNFAGTTYAATPVNNADLSLNQMFGSHINGDHHQGPAASSSLSQATTFPGLSDAHNNYYRPLFYYGDSGFGVNPEINGSTDNNYVSISSSSSSSQDHNHSSMSNMTNSPSLGVESESMSITGGGNNYNKVAGIEDAGIFTDNGIEFLWDVVNDLLFDDEDPTLSKLNSSYKGGINRQGMDQNAANMSGREQMLKLERNDVERWRRI